MKLINADCMKIMKDYPDNYFDLAIVDPPYGIEIAEWDNKPPKKEYFDLLFKVSENQIIWGGNYFILPHRESWICWDKTYKYNRKLDLSAFELAWTSLDMKAKFCRYTYCGNFYGWKTPKADYKKQKSIHPSQKPKALYTWLLENYAKPDFKILDTHLGSGSHAIAWHYFQKGGEFVGIELDKDYFKSASERIKRETQQLSFFGAKE